MNARFVLLGALVAAAALAACGGGGGPGPNPTTPPTSPPSMQPTPVTQSVSLTSSGPTSAPIPTNPSGVTGTVSLPQGSGNLTLTYSATAPSVPGAIQSARRLPAAAGIHRMAVLPSGTNTGLIYVTATAGGAVTMNGIPGFTVKLPAAVIWW